MFPAAGGDVRDPEPDPSEPGRAVGGDGAAAAGRPGSAAALLPAGPGRVRRPQPEDVEQGRPAPGLRRAAAAAAAVLRRAPGRAAAAAARPELVHRQCRPWPGRGPHGPRTAAAWMVLPKPPTPAAPAGSAPVCLTRSLGRVGGGGGGGVKAHWTL